MTAHEKGAGILVGVERVAQPSPCRHEGGDCYACVVKAALQHVLGEEVTWESIDRWFEGHWAGNAGEEQDRGEREPPVQNTWQGIKKALDRAWTDDRLPIRSRVEWAWPAPSYDWVEKRGPAWMYQEGGYDMVERLHAWLAAGWVCITNISYDGNGLFDAELKMRSPDHFVILDGARLFWDLGENGCGPLSGEVHEVCSARGERWHEVRDYTRRHGGLSWLLVRRDDTRS